MNIILTGSLAFDRIMNFPGRFSDHILPDHIHNLNVAFNIDRLDVNEGGTAGNIAYTLALLGDHPRVYAAVGKDFSEYRRHLDGNGISHDGIEEHPDLFTATAHIITDRSNNQLTAFSVGAMERTTTSHVPVDDPEHTMVVISAGNPRDMQRYATECQVASVPYLFDPGQTLSALDGEQIRAMLSGAAFVIVNDYEVELITQKTTMRQDELRQSVHVALIVTKGEHGSVLWTKKGEQEEIPIARPEKIVDPTGAGDAYRAGFLKGVVEGLSLPHAAQCGATAASFAIECYGTQTHTFTMKQFCERYRQSFSQSCPLKN